MSNSEEQQAIAGWYPDPETGRPRWWDGQQWGAFQQVEGTLPVAPAAPMGAGDARQQAALAHYLGVIGFIGPLIIYMTSADKDPFVKDQATEALNFHLTVLIGWVVCSVLACVVIGLFLMPVLWIAEIVLSVMGGMAASRGEWYRYPFNIRMVKGGAAA
jgi:uncharacterized Tic20 family protein